MLLSSSAAITRLASGVLTQGSVSHNERCLLNDVSTMKIGSARLGQLRKRLVGFCLGHSFRAAKTYCQNCAEDYHHPSQSPISPLAHVPAGVSPYPETFAHQHKCLRTSLCLTTLMPSTAATSYGVLMFLYRKLGCADVARGDKCE